MLLGGMESPFNFLRQHQGKKQELTITVTNYPAHRKQSKQQHKNLHFPAIKSNQKYLIQLYFFISFCLTVTIIVAPLSPPTGHQRK